MMVSYNYAEIFSWFPHLAYTGGQEVDNPLVRDGHHALPVDLDDPVAHPDAASLCYSSPQQTADLKIVINQYSWLFWTAERGFGFLSRVKSSLSLKRGHHFFSGI